jgi:hypothetical protein
VPGSNLGEATIGDKKCMANIEYQVSGAKYKIVKVIMTCGGCPSQWEAYTDDLRPVYVRYRWGYLSIEIAQEGSKSFWDAVGGEEIFGKERDDTGWDGFMSYEELKADTAGIIEWPENESTEDIWLGTGIAGHL